MGVYDKAGNSLVAGVEGKVAKQTLEVLVSASDASSSIKENADYRCNGTNDETVIQQAVTYVANNGGGRVRLSEGRFYIGAFPNTLGAKKVAVLVPQTSIFYSIEIIGAALPFGLHGTKLTDAVREGGTVIALSETGYEALDSSVDYSIFAIGQPTQSQTKNSHVHITISDMDIVLPYNQKRITCIDLLYANRCLVERVELRAITQASSYIQQQGGKLAVEGCVGLRCLGGTNNGILADFRNILARGFYEGFKFAGEHVIGINLGAVSCVYGYTFGNYGWTNYSTHPMTFINCCDERGYNLPKFVANGLDGGQTGKQAITFIDFNMERNANDVAGGVLGDYATETVPGTFYGSIEYTITPNYNTNAVNIPFWANDGSGINMKTRNQAQAMIGDSATRRTYAPNYCQQYYDTDVGKMLFCINPASKTWVDAEGNTVA